MAIDVPHFSADYAALGAYVPFAPGLNVSRIFLPLRGPSDRFGEVTWADLAKRAGVKLTAQTLLWGLVSRDEADEIHAYGCALDGFTDRLLAAIADTVSIHEGLISAHWIGYVENNHADRGLELNMQHIGPWKREDFSIRCEPLTTLKQHEKNLNALPNYIWSRDHSFILTCPVYSDSIFLTSDTIDAATLQTEGLEAMEIFSDGELPITGA